MKTPDAFVCGATTGEIPVNVNVVPAAGEGNVTVIVPVEIKQVGWVTLAVGADGAPIAAFMVNKVAVDVHPPTVVVTL